MASRALNALAWLFVGAGAPGGAEATILRQRSWRQQWDNRATAAMLRDVRGSEAYKPWGLTGTLPSNGRVAVLLRGDTFRAKPNLDSCTDHTREKQFNATRSIIDLVVGPLEMHGNTVDLFMQDSPTALLPQDCYKTKLGLAPEKTEEEELRCVDTDTACRKKATRHLFQQYSPRNITFKRFTRAAQGDGIRTFLNLFNEQVGGSEKAGQIYDLVIVTRHDILWEAPIDTWTANFKKFLFASRCERGLSPRVCVNDILHMMPGEKYHLFDKEVGTDMCFCYKDCKQTYKEVLNKPQTGHGCYTQMAKHFGEKGIGFATDWVPGGSVRDHNNFANIQ